MNNSHESAEDASESVMLDAFRHALAGLPEVFYFTRFIMVANVIVFGDMLLNGGHLLTPDTELMLSLGANFGPRTMSGEWWRLLTCMFLHFGLIHLGMNMWIFNGLGKLAERWMGTVGLGLVYFLSGIGGGLLGLAWNSQRVCAGASGAVFGVAGALLGFVILRRDTIPATIRKRLLKSMVWFLVLNSTLGLTVSGIDMAAHVGGFLTGFLCGLILSQPVAAEMVGQRMSRNLATACSGAIVLPIAILLLPPAPPDVNDELMQRSEVESQLHAEFNDLVNRNALGEITRQEFADRLDSDILPGWIACRERTELLIEVHSAVRDEVRHIVDYMSAREDGWRMLAEGMRNNDAALVEQANAKSADADQMVLQRHEQSSL